MLLLEPAKRLVEAAPNARDTRSYAGIPSTRGFALTTTDERSPHIPEPDETDLPELEEDQTIAPRPEEEIADELRAEPDVEDHSHKS